MLLLTLMGCGLEWMLSGSDRQWYPVLALDLVDGLDRSYAGQFRADPAFQKLFDRLPALRRAALTRASASVGLTPLGPQGYALRLKDSSRWSDFGASSRPVRAEQGVVYLVTLSSDQLALGVMDAEASLVHEFIHCLLRERMGERSYGRLPFWFREGLAVWGAGQELERSRNLVAEAYLDGLDPLELLARTETELERVDSYLMAALIFDLIEQRQGPAAVRRLVTEVIRGDSAEQALGRVAGMSADAFLAQRDRFARDFFAQAVAESGLYEFRQAEVLDRFAGPEAALVPLVRLVDERPEAVLAAQAWYWIGRHRAELGLYQGAADAYATVLARYPRHLGLQADSLFRLARCQLELQHFAEAEADLSLFLDQHARAPQPQRVEARRLLIAVRAMGLGGAGAQLPSQGAQAGLSGFLGSGSPGSFFIR